MLGGCNCGKVRYRVTGRPLTVYICHCHLCQKRTGSAFSQAMVLPAGGLEITAGEPERSERPRADGRRYVAAVCGDCHSRLYTQRDGAGPVILRAGTLDDTRDLRPVAQIWTSSAQPWAIVPGDILSYPGQPTDFALLREAWERVERGRTSPAD